MGRDSNPYCTIKLTEPIILLGFDRLLPHGMVVMQIKGEQGENMYATLSSVVGINAVVAKIIIDTALPCSVASRGY